MTDSYGKGLMAYLEGETEAQFVVESDIAETDTWPVREFFHTWDEMSEIERRALTMCEGRTLDVGAGSGSHTLWLQERGVDVAAIDVSPLAAEVMRRRGVRDVICGDFYDHMRDKKYDTLLMLMNGAGIAATLDNLPNFLRRCKSMMSDGGQILLDSSDLLYLYIDEDGSVMIDLNGPYYGELEYTFIYEGQKSEPFKWLFVDQETLKNAAEECGLKCEVIMTDENNQYLARLS